MPLREQSTNIQILDPKFRDGRDNHRYFVDVAFVGLSKKRYEITEKNRTYFLR